MSDKYDPFWLCQFGSNPTIAEVQAFADSYIEPVGTIAQALRVEIFKGQTTLIDLLYQIAQRLAEVSPGLRNAWLKESCTPNDFEKTCEVIARIQSGEYPLLAKAPMMIEKI